MACRNDFLPFFLDNRPLIDRETGVRAQSLPFVDLGLDQVLVYKLDAARATLTPADIPFVRLAPGAGPRHLAFHPRGNFVYVISELLCTMSVFRFDPARGTLDLLQTISTLPPGEAMAAGTSTA